MPEKSATAEPTPATQAASPKLIEIHILQNHVPANLNRDDLGAPKTAVFGGTLRARISSQCLKRSVRWSDHFRADLERECGNRTGMFPTLVQEAIQSSPIDKDEREIIVEKSGEVAKKQNEGAKAAPENDGESVANPEAEQSEEQGADEKTQLIFLGPDDAEAYVKNIESLRTSDATLYQAFIGRAPSKTKAEKDKAKKLTKQFLEKLGALQKIAFEKRPAVDVALYGRMTTSEVFHNVDASMSVAHAISTHDVIPQTDYWTGVDDEKMLRKLPGAGMIQEALFNSATFYKYASLDWPQLLKNLNGDRKLALKTLKCFLNAFARETPSGKRHGQAHNNPPSAILIEIRDKNLPTNYANAFVKPVDHKDGDKDGDLVFNSAKRLQFYVEKVQETYANKPQRRFWLWMPNEEGQDVAVKDSDTPTAGEGQTKLDALVEAVRNAVENWGAA